MITVEFNKKDLADLDKDLRRMTLANLLRGELAPLGSRIIEEAGQYPPSVGYPRTGRLGRSWWYRNTSTDLEVSNLAYYAGWVHGEEQTAVHKRNGWKRLFDVAVTETEELVDRISKEIDRIWTK